MTSFVHIHLPLESTTNVFIFSVHTYQFDCCCAAKKGASSAGGSLQQTPAALVISCDQTSAAPEKSCTSTGTDLLNGRHELFHMLIVYANCIYRFVLKEG